MIKKYKLHDVNVPNEPNLIKIFHKLAGLAIDFGIIFLPGILVLADVTLFVSFEYFILLYSISLIISLIWFYILVLNFYNIKVTHYSFHSKKITKKVKIVFVSDLHIGHKWEETNKYRLARIINKINSLEKDVVLIGGDILNYDYESELIEMLRKINGPKFTVLGNHDGHYMSKFYSKETPIDLINQLESCGVKVLNNEGVNINNEIFVGGIKDLYTLDFDITKSMENSKPNQFKILLSHNPDVISYTEELKDINLILSGHNHNGQINLLGLRLPMPTTRKWLTYGLFKISPTCNLLLSSGVGVSQSRVRIGTKYEILSIELLPEE